MFKKGNSGNPSGRPPGATNKITRQLAEKVQKIIDNQLGTIEDDLKAMAPADRVKATISLMQYVLPKQQSINVENQIELEYRALALLLDGAPQEAVNAIAAKVIELKARGGEICDN